MFLRSRGLIFSDNHTDEKHVNQDDHSTQPAMRLEEAVAPMRHGMP